MTGSKVISSKSKIEITESRARLQKLVAELCCLGLNPVIGIEWEFYLLKGGNKISNQDPITDRYIFDLKTKIFDSNVSILEVEREKGDGQIEIKTNPYYNLEKLENDFFLLRDLVIGIAQSLNLEANFFAQKFTDQPGSALQINLNFCDLSGKNLFSKNNQQESLYLLNSVAGILKNLLKSINLYCSKEDFFRFDPKINENLFKSGKYVAPVLINWGYNNRTAAIRVVGDERFYINMDQSKNYMNFSSKPNGRRIEFRVPPSSADPFIVILHLLNSCLDGINNSLIPPEPTYSNSFYSTDCDSQIIYLCD